MAYQSFRWTLDGRTFSARFEYTDDEYDHVCSLRHDLSGADEYEYYIRNDPFLHKITHWIESLIDEYEDAFTGCATEAVLANKMLRFFHRLVQSIEYRKDRGEYPRYPSEMLMAGWGDCEDSAILLATFALLFEHACAFLSFSGAGVLGVGAWGHIDLGIAPSFPGEFAGGCYWQAGETCYYVAHANGSGDIGDRPCAKYSRASVHPIQLRLDI